MIIIYLKFVKVKKITYDQLKQKTIEKFKISEDDIKYMSFYYKDNEGLLNYINEDDVLRNLSEEITPGKLLLKLNFEINFYKNKESCIDNSFNNDKKKQNKHKKLMEEINDSKIKQINQIIQEKDEEIMKLKKEIEKLKTSKIIKKSNDPAFVQEKENEIMKLKNQIEIMGNEFINNIKNKFESIINEKVKYIDELMDKIDNKPKLFENKIKEIQESNKSKTQMLENLTDQKRQFKQIEEGITNNMLKAEKLNEKTEFIFNDKNFIKIVKNIDDNENIIHKNEIIINLNSNIFNDNDNIINNNDNIINENGFINTDGDNNFEKNIDFEKYQNDQK